MDAQVKLRPENRYQKVESEETRQSIIAANAEEIKRSARFPGTAKLKDDKKRLTKAILSHGSVKPLHQSAFLLKKMRRDMQKRGR